MRNFELSLPLFERPLADDGSGSRVKVSAYLPGDPVPSVFRPRRFTGCEGRDHVVGF